MYCRCFCFQTLKRLRVDFYNGDFASRNGENAELDRSAKEIVSALKKTDESCVQAAKEKVRFNAALGYWNISSTF